MRHRGLRSWLTMLGVFIGIAAVVSLISLGQGLQTAVTGQFGSLSVDKLTIQNKGTAFGPPGSTVVEKLNDHDIKIIKEARGISKVVTRLIRVVNLEYNQVAAFTYMSDIPNTQEGANLVYSGLNVDAKEGRLLRPDDTGKVLLGNNFANTENFGKTFQVGKKIKLNGKDFKIIGILDKSSSLQINGVALTTTKDLEDLLNIKNEYDIIVAQVTDKNEIKSVASDIENRLRKDRNEKVGQESFSVQTPIEALSSVTTILNIVNVVVVGIAMISLIVGGIGIANTMYTSVLERTREIGVMKSIGARNKDIFYIFLIESGLLGLVGAAMGVVLGFLASKMIEYIAINILNTSLLQVAVPIYLILGCLTFGFLIGAISGTFPAIRASKVNVVDALRYE